mgnify:CR=1 FL=1
MSVRVGTSGLPAGTPSVTSPSHAILASLVDQDDASLVSHADHLLKLFADLSMMSLAHHSTLSSSSPAAAGASANQLLARWLARVVALVRSPTASHQAVGLRYLAAAIRGADHPVLLTQGAIWARLLIAAAHPPANGPLTPTQSTVAALQTLLLLLDRSTLWPDVWRVVSSAGSSKLVTLTVAAVNALLPAAPASAAAAPVVYLAELPAVLSLPSPAVAALVFQLLGVLHDCFARRALQPAFRAQTLAVEAVCWRCADVASDLVWLPAPAAGDAADAAALLGGGFTVRALAARVLALLPHAQVSLKNVQTQLTQASQLRSSHHAAGSGAGAGAAQGGATVSPLSQCFSATPVPVVLTAATLPVCFDRVRATSAFSADDADDDATGGYGGGDEDPSSHATGAAPVSSGLAASASAASAAAAAAGLTGALSSLTNPWSFSARRALATLSALLTSRLPASALAGAAFTPVAAAAATLHGIEPLPLSALPPGAGLSSAAAVAARASSVFALLRFLLTAQPAAAPLALGDPAVAAALAAADAASAGQGQGHGAGAGAGAGGVSGTAMNALAVTGLNTTGAGKFSSNTTSAAAAAALAGAVLPLPSTTFTGAFPLYEALSLLQGVLSLEPLPTAGAAGAGLADAARLSPLAFATVLPQLQLEALALLRTLIAAAGRALLPYARSVALWLTAFIAATASTPAAASLGSSASANALVQIPASSVASPLWRARLRTSAFACAAALVTALGVATLRTALVSRALPSALADAAVAVTRALAAAREASRSGAGAALLGVAATGASASADAGDDDGPGSAARNRRRAKKARKLELLASLPTASMGSTGKSTEQSGRNGDNVKRGKAKAADDDSDDDSDDDDDEDDAAARAAEAAREAESAAQRASGGHGIAVSQNVLAATLRDLAQYRVSPTGTPARSFGSDADAVASHAAVVAALGFLTAVVRSPAAASVLSLDERAAIDCTLLTVTLALADDCGGAALPLPAAVPRALYALLLAALKLPSTQPAALSALLPYAVRAFTAAAVSPDAVIAATCRDGLQWARAAVNPAAPPPSLPAATVTALARARANAEAAASVAPVAAAPAGYGWAGAPSGGSSMGGFGIDASAMGGSSGSQGADSSFPLHLFHYQRLFSYCDVSAEADAADRAAPAAAAAATARPAPGVLLKAVPAPGVATARPASATSAAASTAAVTKTVTAPAVTADAVAHAAAAPGVIERMDDSNTADAAAVTVDAEPAISAAAVAADAAAAASSGPLETINVDLGGDADGSDAEGAAAGGETEDFAAPVEMVMGDDDVDVDADESGAGLWAL